MTDIRYIGSVKRSPQAYDRHSFATVKPIALSNADVTRWVAAIDDAMQRFPSRGLVHWYDAPYAGLSAEKRLLSFGAYERTEASGHEQFQLFDPLEVHEVVDLRGWPNDVQLRRAMTNEGVTLEPEPLSSRALIWLPSGVCVGPFKLREGATPGAYVIDGPVVGSDLTRIPLWRPGASDIDMLLVEGERRYFVGPAVGFSANSGIQNWASDQQVAGSILTRLRKMQPSALDRVARAHAVAITDRVFMEYLDCVEAGNFGTLEPSIERARAERLQAIRLEVESSSELLSSVVDVLHSVPRLREELERRASEEVRQLVDARTQELSPRIREAEEELARLRESLDERRLALAVVEVELEGKRTALDATVAGFEREMSARLAQIAARPETTFAEMAVFRALMTSVRATPATFVSSAVEQPPRTATQITPLSAARNESDAGAVVQLEDGGSIHKRLRRAARIARVDTEVMVAFHGVLGAGLALIVDGGQAYDALRAYGDAITAGRTHWIPVTPSMVEPSDLLGRRDSATGMLLPAGSGLLDIVNAATNDGALHLLVLDGFNRAPMESYLLPILQAAAASRSGDRHRVLPLASLGSLQAGDPYRHLAQLVWPQNILVACIPVGGTTALPIPLDVWASAGLVSATSLVNAYDDHETTDTPPKHFLEKSELSLDYWRESAITLSAQHSFDWGPYTAFAVEHGLTTRDFDHACAVHRVVRGIDRPDTLAIAIGIISVLASRAVAAGRDVEESLHRKPDGHIEGNSILAAVRRLCS